MTIVAKRESEGPVRVVQEVGARRPIYCTAVGKALAAWLPDPELDGIIARTVFARKTPRTIATPAAFRRELARIRTTGFAIDNEEHIAGIRCIATPVRDHPETCVPRSASWGQQVAFRNGGWRKSAKRSPPSPPTCRRGSDPGRAARRRRNATGPRLHFQNETERRETGTPQMSRRPNP